MSHINMDRPSKLDLFYQYSNADVKDIVHSIITDLQEQLSRGFNVEDCSSYCEKLTLLQDLLSFKLATLANLTNEEKKLDKLMPLILDVVEKVCVSFMKMIYPSTDCRPEVFILLGAVGRVISVAICFSELILFSVLDLVENFLDSYLKEKPTAFDLSVESSCLDIYTVLDVLRNVMNVVLKTPSLLSDKQKSESIFGSLLCKLTQSLDIFSVQMLGSECVPVMLKILTIHKKSVQVYLKEIWNCIQTFSEVVDNRKQYLLLCGFANYFLPVSTDLARSDILLDRNFWVILQSGLGSKDSINRKRSLYLIKRIVDICESLNLSVNEFSEKPIFWWSKDRSSELSKIWEDFMLLAEVMEEKQVHVIKPLLPRMKTLVKACTESPGNKTPVLLHTSWLVTLLLRCSHHESLQIIRWSAETVLSLDFKQCPMFEQGQDEYLTGPLLFSLQEPKLYSREPGSNTGSIPFVAEKLAMFYLSCWNTLSEEKKGEFFCKTVQNICNKELVPISLMFICRGISHVPKSPCLDRKTVVLLRKLLTGNMIAIDVYFRGAIQGYVVQLMIKLIDKNNVLVEDCMQILTLVQQEESLKRGTALWSQCVTWLADNGSHLEWSSAAINRFLLSRFSNFMDTSIDSSYSSADAASALIVARLLLLTSDAGIATKMDENMSNTLLTITQTLVSVVNSVNERVYMPRHKADKALLVIRLLIKEAAIKENSLTDPVINTLLNTVAQCQSEMLTFVTSMIGEGVVMLSHVPLLHLYMDVVKMLTSICGFIKNVNFLKLIRKCISIQQHNQEGGSVKGRMVQLSAVCILGTLADFLLQHDHDDQKNSLKEEICAGMKFIKLDFRFPRPGSEQIVTQLEWGKVASLYLQHQWTLVKMALQYNADPSFCTTELLSLAQETLSIGLEETSVVLLNCIKLIIPKVVANGQVNEDRILSLLDACWSSLQESRRIAIFWDVLEAFVEVVFQKCLMSMPEESAIIGKLKKFSSNLIETSVDKNGVVNKLATQLYRVWTAAPDMIMHAGKFIVQLTDLFMFGGLIRRSVRHIYDICSALENQENECAAKGLIKPICNEDSRVRATMINLLCHIDPNNDTHGHLATSIIKQCVHVYVALGAGSTISFSNSLVHRQRHRLMQVVLLLENFIREDYLPTLWKFLWSSLELETQPSIRHLLDWIVMWCMYRHGDLREQLWILFEKYKDSKNLVLGSLLSVVLHMGLHLAKDEQELFYSKAIPSILPWCMAHHFQTRIYSQAVLGRLWEQCHKLQLHSIIKENAILQCIIDFNQANRNSTKNVKKLTDSFFFKFLDFHRDFTIETLFLTLPMMTSLKEEDWIRPEMFEELDPMWSDGQGSSFIQLRNDMDHFSGCDPTVWRHCNLKVPDDEEADELGGDVQKKIMPWRQMMLDEEAMSEVEHGIKQHTEGGLVVVTSLINKVPNLGGLCRTSEIFGVSEYVMGRLNNVEDKTFQCLSVSAHRWIPITEVHESKLPDYLHEKKQEGYTLVGVEQTANSVCLTEYTFPVKTLLLLGNEKEGIPVELISLLDVCVEIPQQGVIRSLNVHVSGAILIWEYRRQQIMKLSGTKT